MSNINEDKVIPAQEKGASSDTEATSTFPTTEEAKHFFDIVKQRLLQVNNWQQWAGKATASFQLTDSSGNDVERTVQQGDHFKIDIPGPGSITGDGFDWVQVEAIEETTSGDDALVSVQVRPATNPTNDHNDVAHFFGDEASSCFIVKCEGTTVTAAVHGRNEKPNTKAEKIVDKARNSAVATGAITGFSKLQWKSLVQGLVKNESA